jgi:hypothetical protein
VQLKTGNNTKVPKEVDENWLILVLASVCEIAAMSASRSGNSYGF